MAADKIKNVSGAQVTIEEFVINDQETKSLTSFKAKSRLDVFGKILYHVEQGDFEVYTVTNSQITGTVDNSWTKKVEGEDDETINESLRLDILALNEYIRSADVDTEELSLSECKKKKFSEINARTGELILAGGFDYEGKTFSLRETAQLNMLGAERKKDVSGVLPLLFNTIDDMDTHTLTTVTEVDNFFMAALVQKKNLLDAGTALKDQVRAATTIAEVEAVIDAR